MIFLYNLKHHFHRMWHNECIILISQSENVFRMSSPLNYKYTFWCHSYSRISDSLKAWPLLLNAALFLCGVASRKCFEHLFPYACWEREHIHLYIHTITVWPIYSNKEPKIGCEHMRLRRPRRREGRRRRRSSAPLCSSSDSTGDPAAVNLKGEDHSSLLVFIISFLLSGRAHISGYTWLSAFDLGSHPFGKSQ